MVKGREDGGQGWEAIIGCVVRGGHGDGVVCGRVCEEKARNTDVSGTRTIEGRVEVVVGKTSGEGEAGGVCGMVKEC